MAAKKENAEGCVLNSLKSRNEPLSLAEIAEITSLPSSEIEGEIRRLEGQKKICRSINEDSETTVYTLSVQENDAKRRKLETENTPNQLKTPASLGKRPALTSRGSSKLRQPFKSPLQSRQQNPTVEEKTSLSEEIQGLEAKLVILNKEIKELSEEYSEEELQLHIEKLHEYNEVKDVGQLLIGKLAEIDGTTTRAMYQEFGLELED